MKKILITDVFTTSNVGSAALLENTLAALRETIQGSSIRILAHEPDSLKEQYQEDVVQELFRLPIDTILLRKVWWLITNVLWMIVNACALLLTRIGIPYRPGSYTFDARRRAAVNAYIDCDIVISIGAERINDNFYKGLIFSLYGYWMAKKLGKYVVLYPQTIGPFYFRLSKLLTRRVLNTCDIIMLRDKGSITALEEIGVKKPRIEFIADVALNQPPVVPSEAHDLLMNEGVSLDGRPIIGISALKWTYPGAEDSEAAHANYVNTLVDTVDFITESLGARVVFISTNLSINGNQQDDVLVAEEIVSRVKNKSSVSVLPKLYTPGQLKGILGLLDLCIATRMHATIFATAMNIPTIAINYQFKLSEYMSMIGFDDLNRDIEKLDFKWIQSAILKAWPNRSELSDQLKNKMIELKESALKAPRLVLELLESSK